jgi:hypothetical protein
VGDFNFGDIADDLGLEAIRDPIQLFDALPNKAAGLGYLRQVQAAVLQKWSERRDQVDLALKMNTGTGKTIVGLLIAQIGMNDGAGPSLYLAPDPHLVDRVVREGRRLGLGVVTEPDDPDFRRGLSVCVTSLQRLFNGKSTFGLADRAAPTRVGTVVVDDAHSAVTRLDELSRTFIPAGHPAHESLMSMFGDALASQGRARLLDIQAGDRGACMRVPFWEWQSRAQEVLDVLHPYRTTPLLEWTWRLVGDHLDVCEAIVTAGGIEIVPPLPPVQKFPSFTDAKRRVYLTATLANDSVLVTHFDAHEASIATPVVPDSAADLGDRLILVPQELLPDLTDDQIHEAVAALAVTDNVVVLVPSWPRAERWREVANEIVSTGEQVTAVVERLKAGPVGLVVIINRYDGIDLPDRACRVLVLDGLPQVTSGAERREASALRDSTTIVTRQVQRFEQGLGRGVRSREDRCAVLVLDRRLVELISDPGTPARLSPGTRAQLNLSRQVARAVMRSNRVNLDDLTGLVRQVVDGAEDFKAVARKALLGVTYETEPITPTARPLRDAYNAAVRGDFHTAAEAADRAVNEARTTLKDDRLAGWLMEKAAAYRNPVDPARAQAQLASASAMNPSTLRPLAGTGLTVERPTRRQAERAVTFLTGRYASGNDLRIGVEALLADLAWDPDRTDDAEQALCDLGVHLGFASHRPEKATGTGGDVLWELGDDCYLPIEMKTGAQTSFISKRDIDQLGGTARWVSETIRPSGSVVPLMVHPSSLAHRAATPPSGMRVIDREYLAKLVGAVRSLATALAVDETYRRPDAVQQQLAHARLNGRQFAETYAIAVGVQPR